MTDCYVDCKPPALPPVDNYRPGTPEVATPRTLPNTGAQHTNDIALIAMMLLIVGVIMVMTAWVFTHLWRSAS